jgi:BirA family transcriptional regulator, biotin operon repressor / biotin---[acetyl-CoA-carboxylase] ligase
LRGPGPLWVLADEQTAGRGRRARAWISPKGNLHASLVMPAPVDPALRSFVAALALFDALARVTGLPATLSLKWPNDVLLNGGKVAGILLEGSGAQLVIGFGVNLVAGPTPDSIESGAVPPASVLAETGLRVEPARMLDALAPAFAAWEARLTAEGFAPLRSAWLSRAAHLGQPIRARTMTADHHGTFAGIDASGALILRTGQGDLAIPAADVFF